MSETKQITGKMLQSFSFVFILFIASLAGVIFIVLTTSPLDLGPQAMLIAYGSFYILLFTTMLLLLRIWHLLEKYLLPLKETPSSQNKSSSVMLAALFALGLLILLALQSIGQLDILSTLLVVMFEVIASFYILKRK